MKGLQKLAKANRLRSEATRRDRDERSRKILEAWRAGLSTRRIALDLGTSTGTVWRTVKALATEGDRPPKVIGLDNREQSSKKKRSGGPAAD